MRRPSEVNGMGFATILVTAAAVPIAIVAIELAYPRTDIWANPWTYVALSFIGIGLLIAAAILFDIPIFGHGTPDVRSRDGKNARTRDPTESDSETEFLLEDERPDFLLDGSLADSQAPSHSLQLIEECLELGLAAGGIRSKRVTPEKPHDEVRMALPPREMVADYRQALRDYVECHGLPDEEAARKARSLTVPLQRFLLQAVPESIRQRLATAGTGEARQLAAIEIRLLDGQLEQYPWELIADSAALRASIAGVTVWRRILSSPHLVPRRWTSNLLLTGTAAPLRFASSTTNELAWIQSELSGCGNLRIRLSPGIPSSFRQVLTEYPPAAFHLVAHEGGQVPRPGADGGTTLSALIPPRRVASELSQAGTWLAVFSCHDSATVPSGGGRPPGYEIAEQSGAAVIGMAGPVRPYTGGLFATALYRSLAAGSSAMHAYHEAVCRVRNYSPYSAMWSVPVMYARTNVVPFPVDDEARIRLSFVQIRLHVEALDRELQGLAKGNFPNSAEWARRTARPIVRTECIGNYLTAVTAHQADTADGRRQHRVSQAQRDLEAALSATRTTLAQLGDPRLGTAGRQQVLQDLPLHRMRQQNILRVLDELMEKVG
jgi:hypothetical protein